ncbi:hypothetical protein VTN02DRAFT_2742 [Thermoascus thermophilus]
MNRIMLIDLYERPNSPEASKSRAFVDKIFSLSGPDGGVVGGEDGITTSRPLRDGGREAWDMMRRLREKAWQKAGLDPHQLWTEQAQIQAGVVSAPEDYHDAPRSSFADRYYSLIRDNSVMPVASRPPTAEAPRRPIIVDRQLSDFNKTFYRMTRAHMLPNPVPSRSSPRRYSYQLPPLQQGPTSAPRTPPQLPPPPPPPQFSVPHAVLTPRLDSTLGSPPAVPSPSDNSMADHPVNNHNNSPLAPIMTTPSSSSTTTTTTTTSPSPSVSFLDPAPPVNTNMNMNMNTAPPAAPTPPSMVDPNLHFDWDQWDAVFGQHLPVADEFMELDPVAGFGLGDFGAADAGAGVPGAGPVGGAGAGGGGGNWADFG